MKNRAGAAASPGSPSTVTPRSEVSVVAGVSSSMPSSATRPTSLMRSTSRREATPARASNFAMRCGSREGLGGCTVAANRRFSPIRRAKNGARFRSRALRHRSVTMVEGQIPTRLREKVDIRAMLFGKKKRRISKLLLVEDEPLVAFDNERFLVDEEYEIVATVDRVVDAVRLIRGDDEIDLVLVDVSLADGSGIAVARVANESGVSAMFVTGECPAGGEE